MLFGPLEPFHHFKVMLHLLSLASNIIRMASFVAYPYPFATISNIKSVKWQQFEKITLLDPLHTHLTHAIRSLKVLF